MTPLRAVVRARALRCPRNAAAVACYPLLWVSASTEGLYAANPQLVQMFHDKDLIKDVRAPSVGYRPDACGDVAIASLLPCS
jgi:hypothetical protein